MLSIGFIIFFVDDGLSHPIYVLLAWVFALFQGNVHGYFLKPGFDVQLFPLLFKSGLLFDVLFFPCLFLSLFGFQEFFQLSSSFFFSFHFFFVFLVLLINVDVPIFLLVFPALSLLLLWFSLQFHLLIVFPLARYWCWWEEHNYLNLNDEMDYFQTRINLPVAHSWRCWMVDLRACCWRWQQFLLDRWRNRRPCWINLWIWFILKMMEFQFLSQVRSN